MKNISYLSIGHYRGIEILSTVKGGQILFVAWMERFYSSTSTDALYTLIDLWWKLRSN